MNRLQKALEALRKDNPSAFESLITSINQEIEREHGAKIDTEIRRQLIDAKLKPMAAEIPADKLEAYWTALGHFDFYMNTPLDGESALENTDLIYKNVANVLEANNTPIPEPIKDLVRDAQRNYQTVKNQKMRIFHAATVLKDNMIPEMIFRNALDHLKKGNIAPFETFIFALFEKLKEQGIALNPKTIQRAIDKELTHYIESILLADPDFDVAPVLDALERFNEPNYKDYRGAISKATNNETEENITALLEMAIKLNSLQQAANFLATKLETYRNELPIQQIKIECDRCLDDLSSEIDEEWERVKSSNSGWELNNQENGDIVLAPMFLLDPTYFNNEGKLNPTTVLEDYPQLQNIYELCEQHNAVNAIKQETMSTQHNDVPARLKAINSVVNNKQSDVNIKPGSRIREFFRNIKRILSRALPNKNQRSRQTVGLFSTRSRAEEVVRKAESPLRDTRKAEEAQKEKKDRTDELVRVCSESLQQKL